MRMMALASALLFASSAAMGATYYVRPGGNDNNAGTSHSSAWRSLSKVNSFKFRPGDDVYFEAGGVWQGQLVIDWPGAGASDRAVVGAYHWDGAQARLGVPSGGKKPEIRGNYDGTAARFNRSGAIPAGQWQGLVRIKNDYVTFQDFRVVASAGEGIDTVNSPSHLVIQRNYFGPVALAAVLIDGGSHAVVRDNEAKNCSQAWRDGLRPGYSGCIALQRHAYGLIEGNYVHQSWGESVSYLLGSRNGIIRNNVVAWSRSAAVYCDNCRDSVFEGNMVVGTGGQNTGFDRNAQHYSANLAIAVEDYPGSVDATGVVFRNNLVAASNTCMSVGMEAASRDAGRKVGVRFLGNTCVGTYETIRIYAPAANTKEAVFRNNVILQAQVPSSERSCQAPSNADFDYNYWDKRNTNAYCNGPNDVIGGTTLAKTSGWNRLGPANLPRRSDFALGSGASARYAAQPRTQALFTVSDFPQRGSLDSSGPTFDLTELSFDHFGNVRVSPSAIGGIVGTEGIASRPSAPDGVRLAR